MRLTELQQALARLEQASKQVEQDYKDKIEYNNTLNEMELEASISVPYDQIDSYMSRMYPSAIGNACPNRSLGCLCSKCSPDEYEVYPLEQTQEVSEEINVHFNSEDGLVCFIEEHPF